MKNHILILMTILLLLTSCEEIIEIDLPSNQINTPNVFADKRTAESALANLYTTLRDKSMFTPTGLAVRLGLHTDELTYLGNSLSSDFSLLNKNNYEANILSSIWSTSYSNLYAINSFILGIESSTGIDDNDKNLLKAEAYILRTMYYQTLSQLFGDIPYTTTTDYQSNTAIVKTPYNEILNLIEKDLLLAMANLSDNNRSAMKYYPNKTVAELLLAKNYLLQKNYLKAEEFARKIYTNKNYQIEENISDVFLNNARSTIWQLSNTTIDFPTQEAGTFVITYPSAQFGISNDLYSVFSSDDKRKTKWINIYTPQNLPYNNKYKNQLPPNTTENSILFRLEEVYFILAESLIHQNREKEAIPIINFIRNRAGLQDNLSLNLDREQVLYEMLKESQREFFLEHGRRFFDLKRNEKLGLLTQTKPNWQDKHKLFPYPEKEILMNPNLKPQNDY